MHWKWLYTGARSVQLAQTQQEELCNVVVFMATGMATATLSGTGRLFGVVYERSDAVSTSDALASPQTVVLLMTTVVVR